MKKNKKIHIAYNAATGKEEIFVENEYGNWIKKAETATYEQAKTLIEMGCIY